MTAPYGSPLSMGGVSAGGGGPHLGGGAQVGGGAAGAGVRQHGAGTAADRRGQGGSLGGLRCTGRLAQDAVLLETSPGGAPAEEELIQQLHLWEGEEEGVWEVCSPRWTLPSTRPGLWGPHPDSGSKLSFLHVFFLLL